MTIKNITLVVLLLAAVAFAFVSFQNSQVEPTVNKVGVTPDTREAAFQNSQATSTDDSLAAIEADLNSTVFLEEDFSDLE